MEEAIKKLKMYAFKVKAWIASKALRVSINLRPDIFHEFIQERANELALRGTLGFLDSEGLLHCHKCPRRGQLRRIGDVYACQKHYEEIEKAVLKKAA